MVSADDVLECYPARRAAPRFCSRVRGRSDDAGDLAAHPKLSLDDAPPLHSSAHQYRACLPHSSPSSSPSGSTKRLGHRSH